MSAWSGRLATFVVIAATYSVALADTPKDVVDLADYKTVETAETASSSSSLERRMSLGPAYLGISLDPDSRQSLVVGLVDPDSPAARAGIAKGDRMRALDGRDVKDGEAMRHGPPGQIPRGIAPGRSPAWR